MPNRFETMLVATLLAAPVFAAPLQRAGEAKVSFIGKGPAGFKLVGTTSQLELKDDEKSVTVTVPLATVTTGNSLRDRHMREKYLHTDKFPTAVLVVDKASLKFPAADGQTVRHEVKGQLTIHGVTKEQELSYTAQRTGGVDQLEASFKMNFKDHGVHVPSYLGVTVKPDIELQVSLGVKQ